MLLCRVYHVIAIYPKTMGKRQGINEQEKFGNQSSTADKKLKMNEFLALSTRPWSRFSMLELLFVKIHGQKIARLCVETSQNFYDLNQNLLLNITFRTLKLKNNIYRSKELSPHRKASIKVRKMTLFFSRYNSHRVWERSTFNSKTNFFAWKVHILIVFRKKHSRLAYLLFILSSKTSI